MKKSYKNFKNVWFTSDTHFGDDRLNLFGRDIVFNDANESDNLMIKNYNDRIGDDDLLIHLGDIALKEDGLKKMKLINGTKWLVKGNYDIADATAKFEISDKMLSKYFDLVVDDLIIDIDGEEVFLNHYPTNAKEDMFNVVGHIHGTWKVQRNMINVGVDAWHFAPVSLDTIKFQMNGIRKFYDINVFSGELKSNLNFRKGEVKVLRATEQDIVNNDNDIIIFLAGPIQGAQNWQEEIISKIEKEFKNKELDKNIIIASPRRLEKPENFIYEEQVDWETEYLNKAYLQGFIVFWMPTQDNEEQYDDKTRSYAQTTRFELGEWYSKFDDFVVGVQKGFHGEKYIKYKFKNEFDYDVLTNINDMKKEIIKKLNNLI